MPKLLKVLLLAVLCVPSGFLAMQQKEIVTKKQSIQALQKYALVKKVERTQASVKKIVLPAKYVIKFQDTELNVAKDVFDQFTLYRMQKEYAGQFGDKETAKVFKKSASTEDLGSVEGKQEKNKIKPGTPLMVVWDITQVVEQLFGQEKVRKELQEKYGIDLKQLVVLMLDIASDKKDPKSIHDKNTLLMVIKIADLLGNSEVMHRCNPVLLEQLVGKADKTCLLRTLVGHKGGIGSLTIIPGTKLIVSGSDDSTLRIWNYETGECEHILAGHTAPIREVIHKSGTKLLVSCAEDGNLKVWDYETGKLARTLTGHSHMVYAVVDIPGTNLVVSGSRDTTLKVWNIETGECVNTLSGHTASIYTVMYIPGTNEVVSGSRDTTLRVWDIKTSDCVDTLTGHKGWINTLMLIPRTDVLVSCSGDGTLKVWNVKAPHTCKHTLKGHKSQVLTVTEAGSDTVVSTSGDNTLKVWNLKTWACEHTLKGHKNGKWASELTKKKYGFEVYTVAAIPETPLVVSGADDAQVKVWNYKTGKCKHTFQGHKDRVYALRYLPEKALIVSGSRDATLKIWSLNPYKDLNFAQVELCYQIFTSKKPLELVKDSDDHETLMSLSQGLREHIFGLREGILQVKKVKIMPV